MQYDTVVWQARAMTREMHELGKLSRTAELFCSSWNEENELCRCLQVHVWMSGWVGGCNVPMPACRQVLLQYRRAIRAMFLYYTARDAGSWATVLLMTPHRWMGCMKDFAFAEDVSHATMDIIYKQCSSYLAVSQCVDPWETQSANTDDESRARSPSVSLEDSRYPV